MESDGALPNVADSVGTAAIVLHEARRVMHPFRSQILLRH